MMQCPGLTRIAATEAAVCMITVTVAATTAMAMRTSAETALAAQRVLERIVARALAGLAACGRCKWAIQRRQQPRQHVARLRASATWMCLARAPGDLVAACGRCG